MNVKNILVTRETPFSDVRRVRTPTTTVNQFLQ